MAMGAIGATARGGSCRTALSDANRDARNLFVLWAKEANLSVTIDWIGNIFARREGSDPSLPPIMVGSHLDTQAVKSAASDKTGFAELHEALVRRFRIQLGAAID